MIKIVTVIGARPQIIKAAALSRCIKNHFSQFISEVIVHTGQHYDNNMSQVFFDELGIPEPTHKLEVGSGAHGVQTAAMISGIEAVLVKEQPDYLVLYGDTNSTLAGAVAASKIHIPVVHIEAGLRSFNKSMPEEINRIICDHVSTLLFSPTATGYQNLVAEGFKEHLSAPYSPDHPGIFHCGDVMYDNSLHFSKIAAETSSILADLKLETDGFFLATLHRPANTDNPAHLNQIFSAFLQLVKTTRKPMILPLHPRTSKLMNQLLSPPLLEALREDALLRIIPPVSFLEMVELERNCSMVFTDSGGVQKEAYFYKKPSAILRPETEWVEIVTAGTALITDADEQRIMDSWTHFEARRDQLVFPPIFGDGKAAEFICQVLLQS